MIKPSDKTVRGILDDSVRYIVPEYQRNFEWKKEHAEEFFEDISAGNSYFGTLVFDVSKKQSQKEISIVDGQQRLTTIFIFLAACRFRARSIKPTGQVNAIQTKLSFMNDTTGDSGIPKLEASPSIADIFQETIVNSKWDGKTFNFVQKKRQIAKIKPIYTYFVEKVSKFDREEMRDILEKLYDSSFVVIEIEETQEAFDIFERTNARGMELNAGDLLKNYLFARQASENINQDWESIIENNVGNILRMIKYYYVSNFGYTPKKRLFKELKKHGEQVTPEKLLQDIKEFSIIYSIINEGTAESIINWASERKLTELQNESNADDLNRSFDALKLFGVTQTFPLIIKIIRSIVNVKNQNLKNKLTKKFIRFVETLEKFHFINSAVSQRPGNQVEKYYADKCNEKITAQNLFKFMQGIEKDLKEKRVKIDEFSEKFTQINYEDDFRLIYYIYDRMNNFDKRGGQYVGIYNSDTKTLKKNFNIDHLIAQDSSEYNFNSEDIEEFLHNIGNLLVMSCHSNFGFNNKNVLEKFDTLKEMDSMNLSEVKLFVQNWKNKKWRSVSDIKNNVTNRAKELAERAFTKIWNF
ncbi:hypothetical protein A3B85_00275 [Candidatus Nomurabacteria bacterium RIFCSPHIGHO2_02_FULL_37_13]|uniref:DUF262 domain-containing protein n=1 Tax=Candidatus Nomurabacteria bacterium RIFCSPHIGHO2_02_FULL_37_13 TaxID=1801750 RepID=A0A1F6W458_9BACT|nr:MAG: hypothetical protein A3B85_00275 [Candidatus Nomurabacteria bacterium RIFCSPHIGHO2_02_FULL_37_13]OGI86945.1 MAG: hypothetical protein A2906_00460 [Candidatus Nomurabacteria bacterium RIFCSPLOWO2_01_FULL_37_25]